MPLSDLLVVQVVKRFGKNSSKLDIIAAVRQMHKAVDSMLSHRILPIYLGNLTRSLRQQYISVCKKMISSAYIHASTNISSWVDLGLLNTTYPIPRRLR